MCTLMLLAFNIDRVTLNKTNLVIGFRTIDYKSMVFFLIKNWYKPV